MLFLSFKKKQKRGLLRGGEGGRTRGAPQTINLIFVIKVQQVYKCYVFVYWEVKCIL